MAETMRSSGTVLEAPAGGGEPMTTDTEKTDDTDTTPEWVVNLWEKVTDGVSSFFDGAAKALTNVLGSSNERYVKQLGYIRPNKPGAEHTVVPGSLLAQINSFEEKMRGLTDEQVMALTAGY